MQVLRDPIDRANLRAVVEAFYLEAREDPLLGPVFARHIHDWDGHLARMTDFWASVTLRDGTYGGRPFLIHRAIPGLTPPMFDRWVELFGAATRRVLGETSAAMVLTDHARRMGVRLSQATASPSA